MKRTSSTRSSPCCAAPFGVDFSAYKLPTIRRRLARRMLLRRSADLARVRRPAARRPRRGRGPLPRHPHHGHRVLPRPGDLRRAARAWSSPPFCRARTTATPLRIWVPGCASGEEAYSLAITVLDVMEERSARTSPSRSSPPTSTSPICERARRGIYAQSISAQVAPDLLRRYFSRTDGGYQVSKAVRELCVFARHDVTRRPALSPTRPGELPQSAHLPRSRPAAPGHRQPALRAAGRAATLCSGRSESIAGSTRPVRHRRQEAQGLPQARLVCGGRGHLALPVAADATSRRRLAAPLIRGGAPRGGGSTLAFASRPTRPCWPSFAPAGVTVDARVRHRRVSRRHGDPTSPTGRAGRL